MFGKKLAELRQKMGISQYELADKLALSRGQIANYEQETREPDFGTLIRIADFFQVSLDELLGRHGVSIQETEQDPKRNLFYCGEIREELSDYEAEYLKVTLKVFRELKDKNDE